MYKFNLKNKEEKIKANALMLANFSFPFLVFIFLISFSSAELQLGLDGASEEIGVNFHPETPINYSLIPTVNATEWWITSIGALDSVDAVQHNNVGGVLTIDESWFTSLWNTIFGTKTTDNLTEGSINLYDNQSWNETYADTLYAQYQFTNNNFNGSGNFTTTGWIGIGTATPTMALDIYNGEVNITGNNAYLPNVDAFNVFTIRGGDGNFSGHGANISLTTGSGGDASVLPTFGGDGGDFELTTGAGGIGDEGDDDDGSGGDIELTTGACGDDCTGSAYGNIILVKDGGYVGIGKVPVVALDVVGSANITGDTEIGGDAEIGGNILMNDDNYIRLSDSEDETKIYFNVGPPEEGIHIVSPRTSVFFESLVVAQVGLKVEGDLNVTGSILGVGGGDANYSFGANDFNGSGNFTTTGNISGADGIFSGDAYIGGDFYTSAGHIFDDTFFSVVVDGMEYRFNTTALYPENNQSLGGGAVDGEKWKNLFLSGDIWMNGDINLDGDVIPEGAVKFAPGTINAPSIAFALEPDKGFYRASATAWGFVDGGIKYLDLSKYGLGVLDGSASSPTLWFINDFNTGLYRIGSDRLGITAGNNLVAEFNNAGVLMPHDLDVTGDFSAVDGNFSGALFVQDSIENNGTFLTHSPSIFCGVQEGVCLGIDYKTKEFDWCQEDEKGDYFCDDNNVEILNKLNSVKEKAERKDNCKANNYSWDGECYEIAINIVTYEYAVEIIQVDEMKYINSTCSQLSQTFEVETYDCVKQVSSGKKIDKYQFKENCQWNKDDGYYCRVRVLRNVEVIE